MEKKGKGKGVFFVLREDAEELLSGVTLFDAPKAEPKERRKFNGNPFKWLKTDFHNKARYNFDAPKSLANELSVSIVQQPKLIAASEFKTASQSKFFAKSQEQKFARSLSLSWFDKFSGRQNRDFSSLSDADFFDEIAATFDGENVSGEILKQINERLQSMVTREEIERQKRGEQLRKEREEAERLKEREIANSIFNYEETKPQKINSLVPPANVAKRNLSNGSASSEIISVPPLPHTAARRVAITGFVINNLLMVATLVYFSLTYRVHSGYYDFLPYILQYGRSWSGGVYTIILSVMALIDKFMVSKNLRIKKGYKIFAYIFIALLMVFNLLYYFQISKGLEGGKWLFYSVIIVFVVLFIFLSSCSIKSFIPILTVASLIIIMPKFFMFAYVAFLLKSGFPIKEIVSSFTWIFSSILPTVFFLILFYIIRKNDVRYTGKKVRAILAVVLCVAYPVVFFTI